jgi:sigma-B regulation protein RsbU (phosphoserine phosphatase)
MTSRPPQFSDQTDMPNTILVVDDEPDLELLITQRFRREIRDRTMRFVFASNGQDALRQLDLQGGADLVLTDINMPVMDGLTLLANLNERYPLLKSVIVSAYGDMTNIRAALNRGAFDFVTKPIDFHDLSITLSRGIQEALTQKQAARDRERLVAFARELDVAKRIQQSIVPRRFPPFPHRADLAIHASMQPARSVGGDFYDYFFIDEHRLAFAIGDVTGKGVPAALFMAVSRTLLRATAARGSSPGACLASVNDALCAEDVGGMFVTCFYGVLDTRTGSIEMCNAGHNPPYILRADGSVEPTPQVGGFMLGMFPETVYESTTVDLGPGDSLVLYTDGVTEAVNPTDEQYEEERLEATLRHLSTNGATATAEQLVAGVATDVAQFASGAPQADDITLLVLTWAGRGQRGGSVTCDKVPVTL